MQRVRQEKVNRENDKRKEFLRQKKILEAQAKAHAEADHNKLEALKQQHLKELLNKPDSPDLFPLFLYSQDGSLLNQDDLLDVEAARVQPSILVPNDPISEVVNIQIPMSVSNNTIMETTNAQPLLPLPKNVSVESGQHYSPMSVDVSMESVENVLLSPSISSMSGASFLRVSHVKSSRNCIP